MNSRAAGISWNSIRFKLIIGVLIVMIPLITMLIYNNFYAIHVIRNQVAESNKNMISLYMNQIDYSLEEVEKYLTRLAALDSNLQIMEYTMEANDYTLAKLSFWNRISQDVLVYNAMDSFFMYSTGKRDYLEANGEGRTIYEREYVKDYIIDQLTNNPDTNDKYSRGWCVEQINQEYYLLRIVKLGDIYVGAWGSAKKLLVPLNLINLGEKGASLLVTDQGKPMVTSKLAHDPHIDLSRDLRHYYLTGDKNQYLVVGEKSVNGNFSLLAVIPDEKILEKLPYLQQIVSMIAIGSILLLPVCLVLLRKTVLIPLKRILSAMKRIRDGNLEVRIDPYPTSEEFQIVNETFNKMIDQIHELRISVYEEQLNKQKAELQHLQLQVKPHFFLNSLNIIYSLAQTKQNDLIQEMTLCLVQYFRYMFRSNLNFVPLRDELQHVRNYLRIQELRFPRSLTYEIEAPEFLLDTPIPPLVIQNFVENTVKHSVTLDDPIRLSIQIHMDNNGAVPCIKIVIRDTGKGFTEEVLTELRTGNRISDEQGEHIGIWNVQRRLRLLYSNDASITFANGDNPSGAVVEIVLPIQPECQDKKG